MRILFLFLDGVGLGPADPAVNPLASARLPVLEDLLDGARPVAEAAGTVAARASLVPLDASLGVAGLPQSGTGQAALLTGENAARRFGRHFGPWTPTALRPLLAEASVLRRARERGRTVAFANAYPEEAARTLRAGGRLPRTMPGLRAGPTLAAHAAGLLTRHTPELARGAAVASEITNEGWRHTLRRHQVPSIGPGDAGGNLARIARRHDLTFFAHYTTDHVGHRGSYEDAVAALERVDAFLGGVLEEAPDDLLLLIASDHGNIEDVRAGHTHNPALGLVAGPGHATIASRLRSLMDVAPVILGVLTA